MREWDDISGHGYTGKHCCQRASKQGLTRVTGRPVQQPEALGSGALGLTCRVFDLRDIRSSHAGLKGHAGL